MEVVNLQMKANTVESVIAKALSWRREPSGSTKTSAGKWYPSERETCECCTHVRSPSHNWPWSLKKHCKTRKHLKYLLKKDPTFVSPDAPEALTMTVENAPLYVNSQSVLLKEVATFLLCGKES